MYLAVGLFKMEAFEMDALAIKPQPQARTLQSILTPRPCFQCCLPTLSKSAVCLRELLKDTDVQALSQTLESASLMVDPVIYIFQSSMGNSDMWMGGWMNT